MILLVAPCYAPLAPWWFGPVGAALAVAAFGYACAFLWDRYLCRREES